MKKNIFLTCSTAKKLYNTVKDLPIIDYHCHLQPQMMFEDKPFDNIGTIWLGGDHYKWRLMRMSGVEERYITGDSTWKEKFIRYCKALEFAAGNPLYHWSHMELSMFFGIDLPINAENAETIWEQANAYIAKTQMSPRKLILQSKVETICTTDDIADDLAWHKKLAADETFPVKVIPSFRTDKVLLLRRADYGTYIEGLSAAAGMAITDLESLKAAIVQRLDYFCQMGCRCADEGVPEFPDHIGTEEECSAAFQAALRGETVATDAYLGFLGYMHKFLAGEYKKRNLLSQWHLASLRNCDKALFEALGLDVGGDVVGNAVSGEHLAALLGAIHEDGMLGKTIIYTLNDSNLAQIASIAGTFPNVRMGAAWWFCDHKRGNLDAMRVMAEQGSLGSFYGMLTDSRSFLSYARHDFFRRLLCDLVGTWVEQGEYDKNAAVKLVKKVSYENIKEEI